MPKKISPSLLSSTSELSHEAIDWLGLVKTAVASTQLSDSYPPGMQERLFYVIHPRASYGSTIAPADLTLVDTHLTKSGGVGRNGKVVHLLKWRWEPPQHWRRADHDLFSRLTSLQADTSSDRRSVLAHPEASPVLAEVVGTGRAKWRDEHGPVLTWAPPRRGHIEWRAVGTESMHANLKLDDAETEELELLNAAPPIWVDPREGKIGLVDLGMAPDVAYRVLAGPPIPINQAQALRSAMIADDATVAQSAPPAFGLPRIIDSHPIPVIKFFVADLPVERNPRRKNGRVPEVEATPLVRLSFAYPFKDGEIVIPAEPRSEITPHLSGATIFQVNRDLASEQEARKMLEGSGLGKVSRLWNIPTRHPDAYALLKDSSWPEWIHKNLPKLRKEQWIISKHRDFKWYDVAADTVIIADASPDEGPIDWFELRLGVMIDGEYVDLYAPLVDMILHGKFDGDGIGPTDVVEVRVAGGRCLLMSKARLVPILAGLKLLHSRAANGKAPKVSGSYRAALIACLQNATEQSDLTWRGDEALLTSAERLRNPEAIPQIEVPEGFRAELRPYQSEGAAWLKHHYETGLGGILADDMGLGKTVQSLAFIATEKAAGHLAGPVLVVVPTSVIGNWRRQMEDWAPELRLYVAHGPWRAAVYETLVESDVVLTTYAKLARDEAFFEIDWSVALFDEAQQLKNRDAKTAEFVRRLKSPVRFCLTGTPIENNLDELWAAFDLIAPGYLGDRVAFQREWAVPIEKKGDSARIKDLAELARPFLLRRLKSDVARDLPEKTELVNYVELGPVQRSLYDTVRVTQHRAVQEAIADKGLQRSYFSILAALMKMRRVCCDARLEPDLQDGGEAGSAKLERLMEILPTLIAEGHKVLIFSQFTSMLDLISQALQADGITHVVLTGETRDRDAVINRFQTGKIPVFLLSLKAGGTGLNLVAADTVILYDGWWNPAVEAQAIDRVHRIGQYRPVFVHRLIVTDTVEEKMEILKRRKAGLVKSLWDAVANADDAIVEGGTHAFTEEDIDTLFGAEDLM